MLPYRHLPRRVPTLTFTARHSQATSHCISPSFRCYSDASSNTSHTVKDETQKPAAKPSEDPKPKKKTQAELDADMLAKLQGHNDEGGAAGIEYEDGKPVSMKRSVKNNMFRYI
ncbi:hypothetical protein BDW02DRAFT_29545 [Decorospora gaudefroyi]|uniref:Uncharacterized protein n=1 Tax=Decorospora gaudefroyi TaxID=184978 RepID=A0A6A5K715_9PLEO|nr:hypothetical protein BDW02DRAFT_29545 [Decorospora gaudefroyi]